MKTGHWITVIIIIVLITIFVTRSITKANDIVAVTNGLAADPQKYISILQNIDNGNTSQQQSLTDIANQSILNGQ